MKTALVLFDRFYQRKDIASSRIRGRYLLKYWPEAEEFVQGRDYDCVIYQKVYWKEHARAFKGKKILDLCDPDWMDCIPVKDFMELMDAITVPTETLKEAIECFCDKPVYVVKDRMDIETLLPARDDSCAQAKSVVWFGYGHNATVLDPCLSLIKKLGLKLIVVSNGVYSTSECDVENIKWTLETNQKEIQKGDFALLPRRNGGRDIYKSENKETLAIALGLAVAKTAEDLKRLIDPEERRKELNGRIAFVRSHYDVRESVKEMQAVIDSIKK